jgi:hypothetical protein
MLAQSASEVQGPWQPEAVVGSQPVGQQTRAPEAVVQTLPWQALQPPPGAQLAPAAQHTEPISPDGAGQTGPPLGQEQGVALPGAMHAAPVEQQTGTPPAPGQTGVGHGWQKPAAVHTWLGRQQTGGPPDGGLQTEPAAQQPPFVLQAPLVQQVGPPGPLQTVAPDGQTH